MIPVGLFDRIRGTDEEVEIEPPESRDRYDFGADDADAAAEDGDEFVLPGMAPAEDSGSDTSSSTSTRSRSTSRSGDRVDRLIEQNERIIELLEELSGADADTDSVL